MDASVCTGAGLYASAGLLEGKTTTTHWGFGDNLRAMGIDVVADRVVWQGNHISGAGVSAGIDMALSLTDRVHGPKLAESLQLAIEYDPQPPFNSGAPTKADASTLRLAFRLLAGDRPVQFVTEVLGQAARHDCAGRAVRYPGDGRKSGRRTKPSIDPAWAPAQRGCGISVCLASSRGRGRRSRFSAIALTATITLEPDIEIAPTSGRRTNPRGWKMPAARGMASEL
jgi:hypothetical protein